MIRRPSGWPEQLNEAQMLNITKEEQNHCISGYPSLGRNDNKFTYWMNAKQMPSNSTVQPLSHLVMALDHVSENFQMNDPHEYFQISLAFNLSTVSLLCKDLVDIIKESMQFSGFIPDSTTN